MTQIIPLSFLIHRKYVHSLHWDVPFLAVLRSKLPLWKWPILLLSIIFRRGHIFSLLCQSLRAVFNLCSQMAPQSYSDHLTSQMYPAPRSHSFPGSVQYSVDSVTQGRSFPSGAQSLCLDSLEDANGSCLTLMALDYEQKLKGKLFLSAWHFP